jgi:hypothetical protein
MALNYAKLAATATRLINANGRALTLSRRQAPPAPAEPWKPGILETVPGADNFAATGVFLSYSAEEKMVQGIQENDQRCLITAEAVPDLIDNEWVMIDGSDQYNIIASRLVKPGALAIYYELQVRL